MRKLKSCNYIESNNDWADKNPNLAEIVGIPIKKLMV